MEPHGGGRLPGAARRVGVGIVLTIDAGATGEHNLEIALLDDKDQPVTLFTDPSGTEQFAINASFQTEGVEGDFKEVSVPFALNIDGIVLPAPGTYAISIRVNGDDAERLRFSVDLAAGADGEAGPPSTSTGRPGDAGYL